MASGHGGGRGMIWTILVWLGVSIVVILILLWLVTGGVGRIAESAQSIWNPFNSLFSGNASSSGAFRLPWQPEDTVRGPDLNINDYSSADVEEPQSNEDPVGPAEDDYEALKARAEAAKTFGEPSPHRGKVRISGEDHAVESGANEYIGIEAASNNTAPVDISGWSLQSALTGIRAFLPRGADIFLMGAVNTEQDIYLDPEGRAIISSGPSPVGTSFHVNTCTGYLGEFQTFRPTLTRDCPSPADSLPLTPENIRTYGDACFDFVNELQACIFPLSVPSSLSYSCRIFLANNLSYNGCVQNYRHTTDFARGEWRIYLGAGGELWRNTHDVIRLLDAEGRTVDVLTY